MHPLILTLLARSVSLSSESMENMLDIGRGSSGRNKNEFVRWSSRDFERLRNDASLSLRVTLHPEKYLDFAVDFALMQQCIDARIELGFEIGRSSDSCERQSDS